MNRNNGRPSIVPVSAGTKGCPLKSRKSPAPEVELPTMRAYMAHRSALVDYASKVVGNREQAEDIVQEAWLTLSRRGEENDVREPLGYLRTTVRNLAIDTLRQRVRESRLIGGDLESAARSAVDGQANPEKTAFVRRDLACVMGVLRSLPERQRVAIEMYRFADYKLREIADHLGISVSLAHVLIADGLAACTTRCGIGRGNFS
jgi:RNA polymerase sigma-70 factor (ECF subfamily)